MTSMTGTVQAPAAVVRTESRFMTMAAVLNDEVSQDAMTMRPQ